LVIASATAAGGAGASVSARPATLRQPKGWLQPDGDYGNARAVPDSPIDRADIADLEVAWRTPLTGGSTFGDASTNPVVVDGQVYLEDLSGRVRSIDLRTGKAAWTTDLSLNGLPMIGPNGVAVDRRMVFAIAGRSDVAALDTRTGATVWSYQGNGVVNSWPAVVGDTIVGPSGAIPRRRWWPSGFVQLGDA
jgi:outer membrane protein assembly factor BamB